MQLTQTNARHLNSAPSRDEVLPSSALSSQSDPQVASDSNTAVVVAVLVAVRLLMAFAVWLFFYIRRRIYDNSIDSHHHAVVVTGCESSFGYNTVQHLYNTTNMTIIACFHEPNHLNTQASNDNKFLITNQTSCYKQLTTQMAHSSRVHMLPLDIGKQSSIEFLQNYIVECKQAQKFAHLRALINASSVVHMAELDWLSSGHIDAMLEANLCGPIKLTNLLLTHLLESKGRVINVSSVADVSVSPYIASLAAASAGMSRFSKCLRTELRKFHCHVISIRLALLAATSTWVHSDTCSVRDKLWQDMSNTKQDLYKHYFESVVTPNERIRHEADSFCNSSLCSESPQFMQTIKMAVFSKYPTDEMLVGTFGQKLSTRLRKLIPDRISEYLSKKACAYSLANCDDKINKDAMTKMQINAKKRYLSNDKPSPLGVSASWHFALYFVCLVI